MAHNKLNFTDMKLNLKDTFNIELPADKNLTNTRRQVLDACYSFVTPKKPKKSPSKLNNNN